MAQRMQVILEDDLDGGPGDETLAFSFDGKAYEIDLSTKNADKFRKAMETYTTQARRAGAGTRAVRRTSGTGRDPEQTRAIREWARSQKMKVSERGRISSQVAEAYDAAH